MSYQLNSEQIKLLKVKGYTENYAKKGLWRKIDGDVHTFIDCRHNIPTTYGFIGPNGAPGNESLLALIKSLGNPGQKRLFMF